jgi:hypothetical protein
VVVPLAQVLRAVGKFERPEQFALLFPHRMVGVNVLEHEVGDDE